MQEQMTSTKSLSMQEGRTGITKIWGQQTYEKLSSADAISGVRTSVYVSSKERIFDLHFTTIRQMCLKTLNSEQVGQSDPAQNSMEHSSIIVIYEQWISEEQCF